METNDQDYITRSHLGNILQAGDNVWGFDVLRGNVNDEWFNKLDQSELPDVILIRKSYTERRRRRRRRKWKLATVVTQVEEGNKKDIETAAIDYENFLQDLEEDPDLRANINIYKDPNYTAPTISEVDDEELRISLEEMLEEFDEMDIKPSRMVDGSSGRHENKGSTSDVPSKRLRRQTSPGQGDGPSDAQMAADEMPMATIVSAPPGTL